MKTQIAVLESIVGAQHHDSGGRYGTEYPGSLKESTVKVLVGDEDVPIVRGRFCAAQRFINGCQISPSFLLNPFPGYLQWWHVMWALYTSRIDAWRWTGAIPTNYSGSSTVAGSGQTIVVSGYPVDLGSDANNLSPSSAQAGTEVWDHPTQFYHISDKDYLDNFQRHITRQSTTAFSANFQNTEFLDTDLSGQVDLNGIFNGVKDDLLNLSFPTNTPWTFGNTKSIVYNDSPGFGNQPQPPPNYTGAPQILNAAAEGGGPYPAGALGPGAYSGWTGLPDIERGSIVLWRGQLRYDGEVSSLNPLPYQILNVKFPQGPSSIQTTVIETGFITEKDPTGYVVREAPFVSTTPFPGTPMGSNDVVAAEYNFLKFGA